MPQKKSERGFVEVLIVFAGLIGITAFGLFHTTPKIKASTSKISPTQVPTLPETPIPSATPTNIPDPLHMSEVLGVAVSNDIQLTINTQGEQKIIPLLGVEPPATTEASCIVEKDLESINQTIKGKKLYLVNYDETANNETKPQYVFLKDLTSLNDYLIANGLAKAADIHHPYHDDFIQEQNYAMGKRIGLWSDSCQPTPTPEPTKIALIPSPTLTPIYLAETLVKAGPTKIITPTKKIQSNVEGESTQVTPSVTPTISLTSYLSSSSSATIAENSLNADLILQLINIHRKTKNLTPFVKDTELCSLAQSRAPELYNEIYVTGKVHEGFYKRNLPYWITENMASYPTENAIVNWWLGSTIHRNAIEGNYKYSCGACDGSSCTQLFTSYIPK